MLRPLLLSALLTGLLLAAYLAAAALGWAGRAEAPGEIVGAALEPRRVEDRARQYAPRGAPDSAQVLFGDLHVHTTFSADAFTMSLPLFGGEGARPPADACDFARYCSQLDFWSINDHAEDLTPRYWRDTVDSIRQCDAVASREGGPDTVPLLGWEWTNVGWVPETHWGHKNVVLGDLDDPPTRPIAAVREVPRGAPGPWIAGPLALEALERRPLDWARAVRERAAVPDCAAGTPHDDPEAACRERAPTPRELYARLDAWGLDALVIPHGTAWGWTAPPGSDWAFQLPQHDPLRERLIEVYSGHGSSEVHLRGRAVRRDPRGGDPLCPSPTADYTPSCHQAGEIVRTRCEGAGLDPGICARRAAEARRLHAAAGRGGHHTLPDATVDEWGDAGQCRDCFLPAFDYRPAMSAQYALARAFDADGRRVGAARMGWIGSSDSHAARPGTGYKEEARAAMTEGGRKRGRSRLLRLLARDRPDELLLEARPVDPRAGGPPESERMASFWYTGGLVAVHARGRDRAAIFDALRRREVYGTSGPRILLWFDLVDGAGERLAPMGSEHALDGSPVFRVRALGSLAQRPGCPEWVADGLGDERVTSLCAGTCYHPSDRRRPLDRIEIVRVRAQRRPDEPIAGLIDDPWLSFACPPRGSGCDITFGDPDFAAAPRSTAYYVRALEVPSPAINGDTLGCERDAAGSCTRVRACGRGTGTCLAPVQERAWSSPIWVDPAP